MTWLSGPLLNLQTLVASSDEFRSVVGLSAIEDAKSKVLRWTADDTLAAEKVPRALIARAGNITLKKTSTTGWDLSGGMAVMFEFEAPEVSRTSRAAAFDWFDTSVGQIVEEMAGNSCKDERLEVREFIEYEPSDFFDKDENNGDWLLTSTFIVVR